MRSDLVNACLLQKPLRAGAAHIHDRGITDDLLQEGRNRGQLNQGTGARNRFHALQFFVERQFLVAMIVVQTASKLEGGRKVLKKAGQLLHRRLR
jgi:hypothetical protein